MKKKMSIRLSRLPMTLIVVSFTLLLSSPLVAEMRLDPTPIDRIQEAMAGGAIRKSAGLTQLIYYLLDDSRYDEEQFGESPDTPNGRYDCSATSVFRELFLAREEDRNLDPYGLLWKPWIEEARRIEQSGAVRMIGSIDGRPVRILMPKGRLHSRAPTYRSLARVLEALLSEDSDALIRWRRQYFESAKIVPWDAELLWPPQFLAGKDPYITSYFDEHPAYDAGREKNWNRAIEEFLKAAGVVSKPADETFDLAQSWTWVISDRVQRQVLVWGPEGQSLVFLSPRCLDRALAGDWRSKRDWQRDWRASGLQAILSAFYLNGKSKSFYRDPWMAAVIQSEVQDFLDVPDIFYNHGPYFINAHSVSLAELPGTDFLRWGTAPLWRFLSLANGKRFIQKHFENVGATRRSLQKAMEKERDGESLWLAFVSWSLALQGMPEKLHGQVSYWIHAEEVQEPSDMALAPIDPPKGSIAQSTTVFKPYSVRYIHIPIEESDKIEALKFYWEPNEKDLTAYLYLAKKRRHEQGRFLDFAPIKPELAQDILFTSDPLPSEAFFVVVNQSKKSFPAEGLQLQVTVLPKQEP